jgi:glycerol-3-phosphate dehydrogenase
MYDIIIIGAGVVGSALANHLCHYNSKVLVLEKHVEVAEGVTKANTAIIHGGYDPKPGTLKAKLNARGNFLYTDLTQELNIDFIRNGSLTLAFSDEEEESIKELQEFAKLNKVDVQLLNREQILKREPNVNPNVRVGLFSASAGILAPWDVVFACLENAITNGVEVKTNQPVKAIKQLSDGTFEIMTPTDKFKTKIIINAAGLSAEQVSMMVTLYPGFKTIPTRGEYYVLDRGNPDFVRATIFPAPTKKGKGVLVAPTIHGNYLLGPTADKITDADDTGVTKIGLKFIRESVDKVVKNTPYYSIIRTFSGNRPKTDRKDFIIEELNDVKNFIQLAGIDSPGLASSPAIAEYVFNEILSKKINFTKNIKYKPFKQNYTRLAHQTPEEINKIIKKDSRYGRIICRCETITEGEVCEAINRPLGATTVDGVKRRARPGAGRCQGGFCQPKVIEILAKELKRDPKDILFNRTGSNVLVFETKVPGGNDNE